MYPPHYLDDFTPGQTFVTGGITLTQAQIIEFALSYDPQPFHISVPSGLFVHSSLGSPGLDEVRWFLPVRPDDTLHCELEIIEVKPSRSKPDRGIARILVKGINQNAQTAASFYINHLLKRRPGAAA